jgi:hypothetical protein
MNIGKSFLFVLLPIFPIASIVVAHWLKSLCGPDCACKSGIEAAWARNRFVPLLMVCRGD